MSVFKGGQDLPAGQISPKGGYKNNITDIQGPRCVCLFVKHCCNVEVVKWGGGGSGLGLPNKFQWTVLSLFWSLFRLWTRLCCLMF